MNSTAPEPTEVPGTEVTDAPAEQEIPTVIDPPTPEGFEPHPTEGEQEPGVGEGLVMDAPAEAGDDTGVDEFGD